jgi:Helix-turn-helix of insertion element transposase
VSQELKPQQATAVDLLVSGLTETAAAEAIGVSRVTLWRWKQEPAFEAELNRRRQELWLASVDRLRSLVPKALDSLEAELEGPRRLRVLHGPFSAVLVTAIDLHRLGS